MSACANDNPLDYPATVWRLFLDTPHAGLLNAGSDVRVAEAATPAGAQRLRLHARIDENGLVQDARFEARGCPYTIATGAWLARTLIGFPVPSADETVQKLRAALEIPEDRAHCWFMAQDVLRDLVHKS